MSLFDKEKNTENTENFEILSPTTMDKVSLQDLLELIDTKEINPNPIGQRPPTSNPKRTLSTSREIIETMFKGYSIGSIVLRDIRNNKKAKELYKNYNFLVIDGGHRIRAIRSFKADEFKVFGYTYTDHMENYKQYPALCHPGFVHFYNNYEILFEVYECSEKQSTYLFKSRNKSTPVNPMEMIMSNETSYVAKLIRSRVTRYSEYKNNIHKIFVETVKNNNEQELKSKYWSTDINPRRKWDEYVSIVAMKLIGRKNIPCKLGTDDPDKSDIGKFVADSSTIMENGSLEEIQSHMKEVDAIFKLVDKFFDGFLEVIKHSKRGTINGHFFGAYQAVYFRLLENCETSGNLLKINDIKSFSKMFSGYHSKLAGNTKNQYDDDLRTFKFSGKYDSVKSFCRKNGIAFASPEKQNDTADVYIQEAGLERFVTKLDKRRTVSKKTKREMLADQDGLCFIDGLPLELEEAIFGHDTPWSEGGRIEEGKIIRKSHNVNMGTMSIQDYKDYLRYKAFKSERSLETC